MVETEKKLEIVLFFPPQWNPAFPYLSVPLLAGQLKEKGYNVISHDINVEFYNDSLTKESLIASLQMARDFLYKNKAQYEFINEKTTKTKDETLLINKYQTIDNYLSLYEKRTQKVIDSIDDAVNVIKSEKYYIPLLLYKAKIIIEHAMDITMLPYYPSKMDTNHYYSEMFNMSYEEVLYQCETPEINIFYEYYRKKLEDKYEGIKFFGISIVSESQIIGALTLAKYLKSRDKNVKVILGGSLITRIEGTFIKRKELFDSYCDYVIYNDGEKAIVELAEFIDGKREINEVSNLIYKDKNGEIERNNVIPLNVNEIAIPSMDGIDLKNYYSPDKVILVQMSKGCYWSKCAFCSFSYKKSYMPRDIDEIVKEIEYYKNNYGIKYFRFTDDAIPPSFFRKLAKTLIERKLEIQYVAFARLEREFNYDLLKLIADSGCLIIQWGLETASNRLLKFLNKGTENTDKKKILEDADKAGIANYLFLMYAFPTETYEEVLETYNFVKDNWEHIMNFILSRFCLEKKSILIDNYKNYEIDIIRNDEDFLAHCDFESKKMNNNELEKVRQIFRNSFVKYDDKIRFLSILLTDYALLYIAKYGKDYIKNYTL